VLLGAEFLAMLLVVVYVGAVAVLFLFVVMMLDVDFAELKQGFLSYMPLGALMALALMGELAARGQLASCRPKARRSGSPATGRDHQRRGARPGALHRLSARVPNGGLVLFVAMIGAIVLTLRHRLASSVRDIAAAVGRKRSEGVELKDIRPGQGLG
jgi:NADH-quinone oxidoreductase subunit J